MQQLRELFYELDLNCSGEIESRQLLGLGAEAGGQLAGGCWTDQDNRQLVSKIDPTGEGLVGGSEFAEYLEEALPVRGL